MAKQGKPSSSKSKKRWKRQAQALGNDVILKSLVKKRNAEEVQLASPENFKGNQRRLEEASVPFLMINI